MGRARFSKELPQGEMPQGVSEDGPGWHQIPPSNIRQQKKKSGARLKGRMRRSTEGAQFQTELEEVMDFKKKGYLSVIGI